MSDRMTRRAVLASAGTLSLGGCLEEVGTASAPAGGLPDWTQAVSFTAAVVRSFADEHPASLRLVLANEGEEPLVVRSNWSDGQGGPFNAVWGMRREGDDEVGLFRRDGYAALCVPGDGNPIPDTPVDGCWKPPCEEIDLPSSHGQFELPPEEPNTDEYAVLDGLDGSCLRPGTYVFDENRAGVSARVARGSVDGASVTTGSGWYPLDRHLTLSIDERGGVTASAEAVVDPPETPEDGGGSTPKPTPNPAGDVD